MRCFETENSRGDRIPHAVLSLRERQIVALLLRGHSNREIAAILGICLTTVVTHVRRLTDGLECRGRIALIRWVLCYPQIIGGAAAPKQIHTIGCLCGAPYCAAMLRLIGDETPALWGEASDYMRKQLLWKTPKPSPAAKHA